MEDMQGTLCNGNGSLKQAELLLHHTVCCLCFLKELNPHIQTDSLGWRSGLYMLCYCEPESNKCCCMAINAQHNVPCFLGAFRSLDDRFWEAPGCACGRRAA
jgi:hypothetical protein